MNKGFAAIFAVILVLVFILGILSVFLIRQEKGFLNNIHASFQAYYLAESGIEDALLRIKNDPSLSGFSYFFEVDNGDVEVNISENIGGVLTIISKGRYRENIQRVKVRYRISSENISFHYGAQAGEEGIVMRNNSTIIGNVFSNGNISGGSGVEITDSVIVSGDKIEQVQVGGSLKTHNCYNSQIQGDLYLSGESDCQIQGDTEEIEGVEPIPFPISEETIEKWKKETEVETISGDYYVEEIEYLGPVKIEGDLHLEVGSSLRLQGTVLVSGDLTIRNNAVLELDEDYYHDSSGVIIVEGKTVVRPGAILRGSGQEGSYLMVLSLNNSLEEAVRIDNTSDAGIFYVPYGAVLLNQRVKVREATAYKIILQENSEIEYEIGLQNIFFSSGAGGSWEILSWEKIK